MDNKLKVKARKYADEMWGTKGMKDISDFTIPLDLTISMMVQFAKVLTQSTGWISVEPKRFEITYGGSLKIMVGVNNNIPFVETAIDRYGNKLKDDAISIYQRPLPTPPQEEDTEREVQSEINHFEELRDISLNEIDKDYYQSKIDSLRKKPTQQPQEVKGVEDEAMEFIEQNHKKYMEMSDESVRGWSKEIWLMAQFHHHMNQKRLEGMEQRAWKFWLANYLTMTTEQILTQFTKQEIKGG